MCDFHAVGKLIAKAICPYVYGLHEGNTTGMLSDFQIPSSKVFGGLPQAIDAVTEQFMFVQIL